MPDGRQPMARQARPGQGESEGEGEGEGAVGGLHPVEAGNQMQNGGLVGIPLARLPVAGGLVESSRV